MEVSTYTLGLADTAKDYTLAALRATHLHDGRPRLLPLQLPASTWLEFHVIELRRRERQWRKRWQRGRFLSIALPSRAGAPRAYRLPKPPQHDQQPTDRLREPRPGHPQPPHRSRKPPPRRHPTRGPLPGASPMLPTHRGTAPVSPHGMDGVHGRAPVGARRVVPHVADRSRRRSPARRPSADRSRRRSPARRPPADRSRRRSASGVEPPPR
jgi:hypothetical protein